MVAAPQELWGGWPAGWSKLDGPFPEAKAAAGLWRWKRHRWARPRFALCPRSLRTTSEGFSGAPRLCPGKARRAQPGEGCQIQRPAVPSAPRTEQQLFPVTPWPPSPQHAPRRALCSPSVTPSQALAPPRALPGQEGRRVTGNVASGRLFEAVGRQQRRLDAGSSSTRPRPSPAVPRQGQLCPSLLHAVDSGLQGKGTVKRRQERLISFVFHPVLPKGSCETKHEREYKDGEERTLKASACPSALLMGAKDTKGIPPGGESRW